MLQDLRKQQAGNRDIILTSHNNGPQKKQEGFEGMNYEQLRQPYNPKHLSRNRPDDEWNTGMLPD